MGFAVSPQPDGAMVGVEDAGAVCAGDHALPGIYIIADLDIGGIPNLVVICELLANGFDQIPIIVAIKFIAMPPQIQQAGHTAGMGRTAPQ